MSIDKEYEAMASKVRVADIVRLTGVHRSTLYDWRKYRPALYKALINSVIADCFYQDAIRYRKVKAMIESMDTKRVSEEQTHPGSAAAG